MCHSKIISILIIKLCEQEIVWAKIVILEGTRVKGSDLRALQHQEKEARVS